MRKQMQVYDSSKKVGVVEAFLPILASGVIIVSLLVICLFTGLHSKLVSEIVLYLQSL